MTTDGPGGYDLSPDVLKSLTAFTDMLLRWNFRINLIARGDEPKVWSRHVADSLQLIAFMPAQVQHAVDIGSGAGFPGLVLALATGCSFTLIEADQRKASFLREAAHALAAPVTVLSKRAEECQLPPVALVTARAVASVERQIQLAHPFLKADGCCIFPRGMSVDAEISEARENWDMQVAMHPSRTNQPSTILVISEIRRVG